ncbi:MAG TPA: hypothetical protein VHK27_14740 [Gammaproteobacteria bacterium]|nr:hypothetical protein [Gammaproteobacteria bacterium]
MTDFRSTILTNLRICRDIVENPDRVEALNDTLNALDAAGFGKLVQNFCAQPDPERTYGTEAVMRRHKRCGTPPELPFLHSDSLRGVKTYQIEDGPVIARPWPDKKA